MSACSKSQEFELKSCYKPLVSVHFYGCMLSSSIETYHLDQFRLALYHLEIFDIDEVEWKIDQVNTLRRKDETGKFNTVVSWGELGYIDDWFLERVEIRRAIGLLHSLLREVITGRGRSQLQVYTP